MSSGKNPPRLVKPLQPAPRVASYGEGEGVLNLAHRRLLGVGVETVVLTIRGFRCVTNDPTREYVASRSGLVGETYEDVEAIRSSRTSPTIQPWRVPFVVALTWIRKPSRTRMSSDFHALGAWLAT